VNSSTGTTAAAYTPREELLNALTHGLGAVAALCGGAVLVTLAALWGDGRQLAGAITFVAGLVLLYVASTLYHAIPYLHAKRWLKVFDHCAIYLLIAGTYTPFALVALRDHGGDWMLLVVWILAALGIGFKVFFTGRFRLVSTLLYLGMGWIAIIVIGPLQETLPQATLVWLIVGGLAYTLGTVFYLNRRLPYSHAIWHLFVLAGSVCHYVAVAQQVLTVPAG